MKLLPFLLLLSIVSLSGHAPIIEQPLYIAQSIVPVEIVYDTRAFFLERTLQEMITLSDYIRIGKRTFCNVGARDVLDNRPHEYWGNTYGFRIDDLSLDISSVFPTSFSILRYSIRDTYKRVLEAIRSGAIRSVSGEEAFYLAQRGEAVWIISARRQHEAIVYPWKGEYDPATGCMIAQCGYYNVIDWISSEKCFGKRWGDREILYVVFERRRG